MTVSASLVKELREKTGAGMMDCKNALAATGDMDQAIKYLREKGLAKAAKKTSRIAAEGLIAIKSEQGNAAMIEVNSETDFVARNDDFKALVADLADAALKSNEIGIDVDGSKLSNAKLKDGRAIETVITEKIATIGENIALRRFARLTGGDVYGTYLHGQGSIGVIVECTLGDKSQSKNAEVINAAKDMAMHVAALSPTFVRQSEIDQDWLTSERDIFHKQVLAEGKPENMVSKIVDGKMAKHKKDFCLLDQPFVKNPTQTVGEMIDELNKKTNAQLHVVRMVRFKVGEGIEKKEDDFMAEVKKMAG